ncbi:hypothetical protein [Paenibacillus jiagnxiensis]|uniref:hypothetical protein n=1 Tax=Paenibacillus jiagnxiensis TaxID=3228926 RepID=UPI0033AFA33C
MLIMFLSGFFVTTFILSLIALIASIFRSSKTHLQLNFKYVMASFAGYFLMYFIDLSWNKEDASNYYAFGSLSALIFVIFANKTAFDPFSRKGLRFFTAEIDRFRSNNSFSLKKDLFSVSRIAIVYLFILLIVNQLNMEPKGSIVTLVAVVGFIHAAFFGKLYGTCPYCNYRIRGLSHRTAAVTCKTCRSRVVIHGEDLKRPLGRPTK